MNSDGRADDSAASPGVAITSSMAAAQTADRANLHRIKSVPAPVQIIRLDVEKHRLVVALQADVELIDGIAAAGLARRNQRGAAVGRHQCQNWVRRIAGLAVKIDARVEMQQHAARE